jgi:hypothetical protein
MSEVEYEVSRTPHGNLLIKALGILPTGITNKQELALKTFLQKEEDELAGRWRHSDYPEFVAHRVNDEVRVVNMNTFLAYRINISNIFARSADRVVNYDRLYNFLNLWYHANVEVPEWHKAEVGELWELSVQSPEDNTTHTMLGQVRDRVAFLEFKLIDTGTGDNSLISMHIKSKHIIDAKKVWERK